MATTKWAPAAATMRLTMCLTLQCLTLQLGFLLGLQYPSTKWPPTAYSNGLCRHALLLCLPALLLRCCNLLNPLFFAVLSVLQTNTAGLPAGPVVPQHQVTTCCCI